MAMRNLEVVVTIVDKASKKLGEIGKKVRRTGKEADKANRDFKAFNRTLFTTTAFVGTFVKAFSTLSNSLDQGSQLDRLEKQYERVLGPKGALFDAIKQTTDASIDKMAALQEGLSLANLGIVHSTAEVANIVSKAGVAAKMAGKDSAEGIKQYSEFLKDGNVSHLQFLNLISKSNPALQAQMAILGKAGGIMGQVVSTQQRLAIGQSLLGAATKGQLKGFRDIRDVLLDVRQNFAFLKKEIGVLLGKALAPLIDKVNTFIENLTKSVEYIRKNEKNLVFLTKAVVVTSSAVLALAGALGTLRLVTMSLGYLGFGIPKLTFVILALGSAFLGVTKPATTLMAKLKLFGAFIRGISELVANLDLSTGISKMDKSLYDLLKRNGLLELAQNIARIASTTQRVVKDVVQGFQWLAVNLDNLFGGLTSRVIKFLANFNKPWSKWWIDDAISPIQKFVRAAGIILGGLFTFFAGRKLFGALGGLLSRIPVIGKIFGGGSGGKGPRGTPTDPIYTVQTGLGGVAGGIVGNKISGIFRSLFGILFKGFKMAGPLFALSAAGALGAGIGLLINKALDSFTQGKTKEGFKGNFIERTFFDLFASDKTKSQFKSFQNFQNSSDVDLVNKQRAKTGKAPLTPEQINRLHQSKAQANLNMSPAVSNTDLAKPTSTPVPGSASMEMIDALGEQLKSTHGSIRKQKEQVFENALNKGQDLSKYLTKEEAYSAFISALDNSKNLSEVANAFKNKSSQVNPMSKRVSQ